MKNFFAHESAIIDKDCSIGEGTKIWHFSHIMTQSKIGVFCNIGQNVVVSPDVILGNNVKVQNNVSIYTGVSCEDHVFLGPSVVFTNITNPRSEVVRREEFVPTHIKKGASIGANATVICGITIGEYAFIGAGTVVTKDVLDYALIVGNPGKQVGWMSEKGFKLKFNTDGIAECSSGDKYEIKGQQVRKL